MQWIVLPGKLCCIRPVRSHQRRTENYRDAKKEKEENMRVRRVMAVAACSSTLLLGLSVSPANSAPRTEPASYGDYIKASEVPQDVAESLTQWRETGKLSPAGKAKILQYPEIAAKVIDPDRTKVSERVDGPKTRGAQACVNADRYINYYTVLGSLAVRWHSTISYCTQSGKVVQSAAPAAYLSDNNGTMKNRGFTKSTSGNKTRIYYADIYGEIENCFGDLCGNTENPRAHYKVYGATASYEYTPTP
ncbi:hypothetical protein ACFVYV_49635 [Streptomyces mirabilis]|uniref:hypothetical protein n=1 Tax=Streptomyces mirabilis TaxID=68239 RepID=UPI0036D9546D